MGYMKHHAIIVTSWNEEKIIAAHERAKKIFSITVSELVPSFINGHQTFLIAPDGSKEGWLESNEGDKLRDMFIDFINSQAYDDGSNSLDFVELYYGEDNNKAEILRHN